MELEVWGGGAGAAATPRSIPAAERLSGPPGSGLRGAGAVSSPSAGWKLLSLVSHTCTRLWAETPLPGGGWCQQVFQQSSCCVCAEPAAAPRPGGGGQEPHVHAGGDAAATSISSLKCGSPH